MTATGVRQTFLLALLFVVAAITLIALDNRQALDPVKSGIHNLVSPAVAWVNDLIDREPDPASLQAELDQVTAERDALMAENAQLQLELAEVDKLRQTLEVQANNPTWRLATANVIGGDPSQLQKFVTIDQGSRAGIEIGMAVVDPYFLVGIVTEVDETTAQVTLAIDGTFEVGAQLLDAGGVGIVYGRWQYGERMEMRHVSRDSPPAEGELVVTSQSADARTANVPGGIIIGKVTGSLTVDNQSDSLTIPVLPAADFDQLDIVAVIIVEDAEP